MKNKIIAILIITLFISNPVKAGFEEDESVYYTGESFFSSPGFIEKWDQTGETAEVSKPKESQKVTVPPVKQLRLYVQKKHQQRKDRESQLAPTDPNASIYNSDNETSDFASKEQEEDFDENMMPDGFEADEEAVKEYKKAKHFWEKSKNTADETSKNTENIVLDCDNMDYDTNNYCLYATGNVSVEFVNQETVVKADKITYDRMNNTIKAEGNVHILKNGQRIDGDYIFVDMNEENALIENPVAKMATIEIKSRKGYVYGDKIVQEQGSIDVQDSYNIRFKPSGSGPQLLTRMMFPKDQSITEDMQKGQVKIYARELIITQKGDLETIAIKHGDLKKGKYTLLKVPAIKVYTNKNHEYAETNIWEIGSFRDLGTYIGPGFVFEMPKGSVLKAIPMVTYDSKFGIGVVGRYNSGTNFTQAAYGTAKSKILIRGRQKLDDNLTLQYAMNDYMDEWWLGRRRPKYGLNLAYRKAYTSNDFLLKNHRSRYEHMIDVGYYHDIEKDRHFGELRSAQIGTMRARYMAQAEQNLFHYMNEAKLTAVDFGITSELAASVYGTGDTQVIGRVGPLLHTQYRRWMQDIGYFQSVYEDNSPIPVYDAYRYGKSNLYLREYFRINKYLVLSWFGSINLSGDSPNNDKFQENSFWISLGPNDVKFNIGYDFIRRNTFFSVEMLMDAKGTHIDYDKLVIKRDNTPAKETKESSEQSTQPQSEFRNSEKAPVLERAVVEDIKPEEDVL